jgi:hypothetical protein
MTDAEGRVVSWIAGAEDGNFTVRMKKFWLRKLNVKRF